MWDPEGAVRCSLNDAVCQMSPIHRLAVCFQFRLTPGIVCVLLKSSMRAIVSLMESSVYDQMSGGRL